MVPGDERAVAAAGHGHLRASRADRERVIQALKVSFVQGRLSKAEFDLRMSRTFASRTYADLAALTVDLPAGPLTAQPPPRPVPADDPADDPARVSTALGAGACMFVWLGLVLIPVSLAVQAIPVTALGVLCVLVASPVAGSWVLETWRDSHPGRRVPPHAPHRPSRG